MRTTAQFSTVNHRISMPNDFSLKIRFCVKMLRSEILCMQKVFCILFCRSFAELKIILTVLSALSVHSRMMVELFSPVCTWVSLLPSRVSKDWNHTNGTQILAIVRNYFNLKRKLYLIVDVKNKLNIFHFLVHPFYMYWSWPCKHIKSLFGCNWPFKCLYSKSWNLISI